jgi:hypothetical protein
MHMTAGGTEGAVCALSYHDGGLLTHVFEIEVIIGRSPLQLCS